MQSSRWARRAPILAALGLMLLLAACSAGGSTGTNTGTQANATATSAPTAAPTTAVPTPTPVPPAPTPTPTLPPPPVCGSNFTNPNYVSTLPDATATATNVFAQVQLPPETRSYDNDASGGFRGRNMCSGGTTTSVTNFMTQSLTAQGWQMQSNLNTCSTAIPGYAQNQCWQNGGYTLFIGINSAADWFITWRDPDFH